MNKVGIVGRSIPTSAACCLYYTKCEQPIFKTRNQENSTKHTLSPIHLIAPASLCVMGDKTLPIDSVFGVTEPGSSTEEPLKTLTLTSCPLYSAKPTSTLSSSGSPIKIFEESDFGINLKRPAHIELDYIRSNAISKVAYA